MQFKGDLSKAFLICFRIEEYTPRPLPVDCLMMSHHRTGTVKQLLGSLASRGRGRGRHGEPRHAAHQLAVRGPPGDDWDRAEH